MKVKGVGQAKAVQLLAAAEIGKRLVSKTFRRSVYDYDHQKMRLLT